MKKDRRWMKSILAAAQEPQAALPWARGSRRRPEAMKSESLRSVEPAKAPTAVAAR